MINGYIESDTSIIEKAKQFIALAWRHFFYCYILFIFDSWKLRKKYPKNPKTLVIIRMDAMGDYMLFRNFIEIVRKSKKYEGYSITLCGNVLWKDIAEKFDKYFIDDFFWIERERFIVDMQYRTKVLTDMQKRGFSVAIQPVYSREFLVGDALVRATDSIERIGSVGYLSNMTRHQKIISDRYYTRLIPAIQGIMFEFFRNKEFFQTLLGENISTVKQQLDISKLDISNTQIIKRKKYVILMPGAGASFRRWKSENFANIATYLKREYGMQIIVGGGIQDEKIAQQIISVSGCDFIESVAGKIDFAEFIILVSNAALLITNETGAAHIGASVGAKTVCISNGNHFGRFNPYPTSLSRNIFYAYPSEIKRHINNNYMYLCKTYGNGSSLNINSISVADVKNIIDEILV